MKICHRKQRYDSGREIWVLDGGTIEVELTFTEAMDVTTLENNK